MMKQRLNIPAVLVHTIKNKQYKVNGIILSINESNDTCTMRFLKDNLIERNIPMNKVLISEGFLDKIKEYGKKVTNFIVKKVKGFIGLVDEVTNKVLSWSIQNVGNLAIQAARNELPEGVYFAPSNTLKKTAGVGGMTIDEALAPGINNDINEINRFWQRVIKRAGTTKDETISESVRYVKKHYYRINPAYKRRRLNENIIYTIDDVKWGENKLEGIYGKTVGAKALAARLITNFQDQISGPLGGHSKEKPYIIWGAPGIGKTAIVQQAIKQLAHRKFGKTYNLNLIYVQLSTMTVESWTLPKDVTGKRGDAIEVAMFGDTPPCWLPVYLDASNEQINAERDMYYNSCKYLAPNEKVEMVSENGAAYEGGIIFFDEYTRRQPGIDRNLMALVNEHKFGQGYKLASKWGFVFAANRAMDDGSDPLTNETDDSEGNFLGPAAVNSRFKDITYVPTKKEWLEWAKKVNEETGEAKIMPFIVDFIEASDENVWYSTVVNGGYDDLFDKSEIDSIKRAHETGDGREDVAQILARPELKTKRMVTPRDWDKINDEFKKQIIRLFEENPEGIDAEDYYKKLVKKSVIEKTDKEGNSYKEYYGAILPDILIDALNNLDEEYWDFWVEEHGGYDELDPSGSFTGVRGRYNILMALFVRIMQENTGDNANPEISQSPIMKQWRAYNSYASAFTPENIESIWETGNVLSQYQKDDDKVTDFRNTAYSKWKQNTALINEVLNKVYNSYPGDLESDLQEDLDNIKNAKKLSPDEVKAEAERLYNEYSFKLGTKSVNLLFNKSDFNNIEILTNKVTTLLNSQVAQRYAHFALWVAKISIQTRQAKYAIDFANNIMFLFRDKIDSDISAQVLNKRKVTDISNKKRKDPNNPVLKTEYEVESSKMLIISATNILNQAKSYEFNNKRK